MSGNKHNLYILSKVTEGDSFTNEDFAKVSATISRFNFSSLSDNEFKRIQLHLDKPIENADPELLKRFSSKLLTKINNEKPELIDSFLKSSFKEDSLLSKTVNIISVLHDKDMLVSNIKESTPSVKRAVTL